MDEWSTVRAVLAGRMSMARLGDGELKLARGEACITQPADPGIAKRIRRVMHNNVPGLLVCIPRIFKDEPPLASKGFWPQHIPAFVKFCAKGTVYGSAFVSRRDAWPIADEPTYWATWRKVWDGRPVLLVTGSGKGRRSMKLLGNAASVDVLDVPRTDAWAAYKGIVGDCRAWAAAKAEPLVAAAMGASATVLAHELAREGIQTLDLGHMAQSYARVSPKGMGEP